MPETIEKKSFETALRGLETSVEALERGDLALEESLRLFEEGVRHAGLCRQFLQEVEARVELLLRNDDGGLRTEPFREE